MIEIHDQAARRSLLSDKVLLRAILELQDAVTGFTVDPTATPQTARQLMIQQGILPEDNEFSCEIRRSRDRQ